MRYSYEYIRDAVSDCLKNGGISPLVVAIDGNCAAGKTTLAARLQSDLGGNVIHTDDFYLQKHQRTKERLCEVGGNVDYERFKEEALKGVKNGEKIDIYTCIHPDFNLVYKESLPPEHLNIVEGSYSLHPYFGNEYNIRVFLEIDYETQLERIRRRNGEIMLERFKNEWIPKENEYFRKFNIKEGCDIYFEMK